jgi:hypothetical protein
MDYKQKYLKYLKKYNHLVGGADPEFERILSISKQDEDEIQRQRQQQEIELQKAMRESMKPVFRREERAMEAAAGPAPDDSEYERILRQSEQEYKEIQRQIQKEEIELQKVMKESTKLVEAAAAPDPVLADSERILDLSKYDWYNNEESIKEKNKKVESELYFLIRKFSTYEELEDQQLFSLFNSKRNFADVGGTWKGEKGGKDLSIRFHNLGLYNSDIMYEHFINGIIYSGIINRNRKKRSETYISPEQAFKDTQKYPIIFELNIVTMYIKLIFEEKFRGKIYLKLDSLKDKLLWREIQKLFHPLINLLIKLLKISITLPIHYDSQFGDTDINEIISPDRNKAQNDLNKNQKRLSILIKDYVYPAVKYFILKLENGQVVELY